jgi:hypothetical protein
MKSNPEALPAPTGDTRGYELAFQEGVRRLEHQESSVDELRSRSGTLLAAAALATSFLGAAALPDGEPWSLAVMIAVSAFVWTIVACLIVLWPKQDWRFVNDPTKVIGDYVEGDPPASIVEIHRDLALHAECNATHNHTKLRWLYWAFDAAALGLLVQVLAWLLAILGGTPVE